VTPAEALALALDRARRGRLVFPVAITWDAAKGGTRKRPMCEHGHLDATTDPDAIRAMFGAVVLREGEEAGYGWRPVGRLVLDLDVRPEVDGADTLAALEAEHGRLPDHPVILTPSGGSHQVFRLPEGVAVVEGVDQAGPGIDIKGERGWLVGEGTRTSWGSWERENPGVRAPLASGWLLDRLSLSRNGERAGHWAPLDRDALDPRDRAALEAAEALGGHGAYRAAEGERSYVALTRPGKAAGTSATIGYVGPGVTKVFTTDWPGLPAGVYDADHLALAARRRGAGRGDNGDEAGDEVELTPLSEIRMRRVRWGWRDRLALGTLALLAGPEGLGKSLVATTLGADLTRGRLPGEHFGHPRSVIVAATEDAFDFTIKPRFVAAGADPARVYRVGLRSAAGLTLAVTLPDNLPAIERQVPEIGAGC
jgi:hypothetical protein